MKLGQYFAKAYQEGTQISEANRWAAIVIGSSAHGSFPFIFTEFFELPYENLFIRFLAVGLCLSLLFKDWIDALPHYSFRLHWHIMLIVNLPLVFNLNLIMNNFHELWLYWEIFMVFVLLLYVPHWLIFLIDYSVGTLLAVAFYWFVGPQIELTYDFNIILFGIVVFFSMVAGYWFSYSNRQGVVAQERNTALKSMAGSIAHEMRNPLGQLRQQLNSIEHLLTNIEQQAPRGVGDSFRSIYQRLGETQNTLHRGVQVIDMILSEVRDKPLNPEQFHYYDIRDITQKAVDEYNFNSDEERACVQIDASRGFMVRVDETAYLFIVFNLLKNALFQLQNHSDPRIHIRFESGDGLNQVVVRDNGSGIADDILPHLFDSYFTRGNPTGTGLGLSYCKRVMDNFNGSISVHSQQGVYAEFHLRFPSISSEAIAAFNHEQEQKALPLVVGQRILIVDDEPIVRTHMEGILKYYGAEAYSAVDGKRALNILKSMPIDVVIMDLNMPEMDGYEATRHIRAGEAGRSHQHVPIVAHTAEPSFLIRNRIQHIGMQGLIPKGASRTQLLNLLAEAIQQTRKNPIHGTILIVEDDGLSRMSLAHQLHAHGYDIVEAIHGLDAQNKLHESLPDAILMDFHMPECDGFEATRLIRRHISEHIPIIGLTGNDDGDLLAQAHEVGMDTVITKGSDPNLLIKTLVHVLEQQTHAPPDQDEQHPNPDHLDISSLLQHYQGDPVLHQRISQQFMHEHQDTAAELERLQREEDWQTLGKLAHRLTSVGLYLNVPNLQKQAQGIERAILNGEQPHADVTQLIQLMRKLLLAVHEQSL